MPDNTSSHMSNEYDDKIEATIPFYQEFHKTVIDLVKYTKTTPLFWLDTGCGTGTLCFEAAQKISDVKFTLADPSNEMLSVAKNKLKSVEGVSFIQADSGSLDFKNDSFDIITAIQCHHYLSKEAREHAVQNCFRMLKPNGIFITFENILPFSEIGVEIAKKRWERFQIGE